jgi:hypothetical protein
MIPHNKKFNYEELIQVNNDNGTRHYVTPHGNAPSVTTILSATKDHTFLTEWRNRIGDTAADDIVNQSVTIGTHMHNSIEHWIKGEDDVKGSNILRKQARKLAKILIQKGLKDNLSEYWGSEVHMHLDDLYAGTTDLVGVYDGTPSIIDFKNSRKPKKEEYIEDYKHQLVAYGMAHNEKYGTNIKQGVILMMSREGKYFGEFQRFYLHGSQWDHYEVEWLKRLERFYEKKC